MKLKIKGNEGEVLPFSKILTNTGNNNHGNTWGKISDVKHDIHKLYL